MSTFTLPPASTLYSPKSSVRSPDAATFLVAISSKLLKLTLGCTAVLLLAALTVEANALVRSEALITIDVTAESSFFICAFPFRAYALIQ